MSSVRISEDLSNLMSEHESVIKNEYITYRLFVDSAIRSKLRAMGLRCGQEEIVPHLEKLKASKARHLESQALSHTLKRHKQRIAQARRKLREI